MRTSKRDRQASSSLDWRYDHCQWISAMQAVQLLSQYLGDDEKAKIKLITQVREGELDAWASAAIVEIDVGPIKFDSLKWNDYKPILKYEDCHIYGYVYYEIPGYGFLPLSSDFMAESEGWAIEDDLARWEKGILVAKQPLSAYSSSNSSKGADLNVRKIVRGIEFRQVDIEAIVGIAHDKKNKGGRPADEARWTIFWHGVIEIARSDRLKEGGFKTATALADEILEETGQVFSGNHINGHVKQIFNKFIAPVHRRN